LKIGRYVNFDLPINQTMNQRTLKSALSLVVFIVLPAFSSYGQELVSKQVKDSLVRTLPSAKQDTNAINNLLKIAYYKMNAIDLFGNNKKKELNSILSFIKRAELLSNQLNSIQHQQQIKTFYAWYYFSSDEFEKGRKQLMTVIQYYKRTGNLYLEANTWSLLAGYIDYQDSARRDFKLYANEQAYYLYKKGNYKVEEIGAYKSLADVHFLQGKLDLAEKELLEVLSQYRKIGYKQLHYTYDLLATVYNAKNDQKNELLYRLMMIQTMENSGSIQVRSALLIRVADIYINLGRFEKAYNLTLKAMSLYKNDAHDYWYYQAVTAAADALMGSGNYNSALNLINKVKREKEIGPMAFHYLNIHLGDCYMNLKKYDQAEPYIFNAYTFFRTRDPNYFSKSSRGRVFISLANIKIHQRNFKQAHQYLVLADKLLIRDHQFRSNYELASSKVDSAQGHFASSFDHYKIYKQINDSLYNIDKSRQIAELEVQYETREKEQSIKLLHTDAISQKAKMDKVNLQRDITFAALILLTIIGLACYRFYLYKQKNTRSILKNHKLIESKNKQLNLLLEEKEWLLKEVHHRVKNNLHTIICLLESQAVFLQGDSLQVMENSQNRIYTMSLIHQKLYQSEDIKTIDMSVYIPELVQHLKDSFGTSSDRIHFNLNIEKIGLPQAVAIPIALIINEAITNSIKYAFTGTEGGEILISLREEAQSIHLEMADNGIGIPEHLTKKDPNSLGLQLIKGLSKEIKGELIIKNESGVSIIINFSKQPWNVHEYQAETC